MAEKHEPEAQVEESIELSHQNLPLVREHVPFRVWLISVVILLERAAYYGSGQPFQNYLQLSPDDPARPGALGLGQARGVMIIYLWFIYTYSTPLIGALVADCWLGRPRTIQLGYIFYILGLSVLTGTAFSQRIYHTGGLAGFIVAIFLIGLGVGAVRPTLLVFLIDQYPEQEPRVVVLKNGKSALTSREVTIQYIYNVNYWLINVGGLAGIVTTITEKNAGFGFAYLIPLCLLIASAIAYQAGSGHYESTPPPGNVLTEAFKALSRRSPSMSQPSHEKIMAELKIAFRACLVFLPFPALMLCADIMESGLVAQAGDMQTHGLPNDIMYNLNPIAVMVFLPIFQGWIYPSLAKRRINFSPRCRIAVGLFCSALAMGYSAGLQGLIYSSGPCYDHPLKCGSDFKPNDVNVGLQTPTYVFLALAEILAIVAGTELAYTQAPESMKSIVQAIFLFFSALGAVIGVGVSFAAEDPNMVIVYGSIAGFLVVVSLAFSVACFSSKAFI